MMNLYKIEDSESHHICARNMVEAVTCYVTTVLDGSEEEAGGGISIDVVPPEHWPTLMVRDDDRLGTEKTPATHYIGDPADERDAFLVCSTCY